MTLRDANVVLGTMRPNPDEKVLAWLESQVFDDAGWQGLYIAWFILYAMRPKDA